MRYGSNLDTKSALIACWVILIVSLLFVIGGSVFWGLLDILAPFNALPLAIVMVVVGSIGLVVTFIVLMCVVGGAFD